MGVLDDNRSQIVNGGLISASFVSDLYDVLTGNTLQDVSISGSLNITGSLIGDLTGTADTASYVTLSQTASYVETAQTASYVANAISASYMSGSSVTATSASINRLDVSETFIANGTILFYTASLPTTDPGVNGQLWRSGSCLQISLGTGSL
jgi:hypothetical protein